MTSLSDIFIDTAKVETLIKKTAKEIIIPRYKNLQDSEVMSKTSPQDQVTIADQESEVFLMNGLMALLPDALFVGEELVHDKPETVELLGVKDRYTWVVDPLDGTRNFINGESGFGVMVALVKNEVPVAGWIYNIIEDLMISCTAGIDGNSGVFINGGMIERSSEYIGMGGMGHFLSMRTRLDKIPGEHRPQRMNRISVGFYQDYLEGRADYFLFYRCKAWDHYAGMAMILQQGGLIVDWDGKPFSFVNNARNGFLIARDRMVADQVIEHVVPVVRNSPKFQDFIATFG